MKAAYLDDTGRALWTHSEQTDRYRFKSIHNAHWLCGVTLDEEPKCFDSLGEIDYDYPSSPLRKIAAYDRNKACALTLDGQIICWAGEPDNPLLATKKGTYTDLDLVAGVVCGLTQSGQINCWGEYATLHKYPGAARLTSPPQFKFTDFSLSGATACALTEDKRILCWGKDEMELIPGQPPR